MIMKKHTAQAAPRLQFADEETNKDALKKPAIQEEKTANKLNRTKTISETRKPRTQRLHFVTEQTHKPKSNSPELVRLAMRAETHRQIAHDEDENVGLQAAHSAEHTSEPLYLCRSYRSLLATAFLWIRQTLRSLRRII